jgi:hypothetical protein
MIVVVRRFFSGFLGLLALITTSRDSDCDISLNPE